jgi:hypothetical protein
MLVECSKKTFKKAKLSSFDEEMRFIISEKEEMSEKRRDEKKFSRCELDK